MNKYELPITVHPVRGPDDFARINEAAAEDNHYMSPTHFVLKDGEIVGCFNIGPTVHWWMHSKKTRREDSRFAFCALDTLQRQSGLDHYLILCNHDSPYYPVVEEFGFSRVVENTSVFLRK